MENILERDDRDQQEQEHHADAVDPRLIFGVELFARDALDERREQQADDAAAVQRRDGQQVHYTEVDGDEGEVIQHDSQPLPGALLLVGRLRDLLDDADRSAHVLQARAARKQVPEAEPYDADKVDAAVPREAERPAERFFLHVDREAVELLAAEVAALDLCIRQAHLFAAAQHHDVRRAALAAVEQHRDVARRVDALAADGIEAVARLQLPRKHAGRVDGRDGARGDGLIDGRHIDRHDKQARHEIHKRTGHQNEEALPDLRAAEGARIVAVAVLTLHGAIAADGDAAQRIQCLALLLFPDRRTHKQGEFIDLHTGQLRRQEMAELMHEHEQAEQEDRYQNINNGQAHHLIQESAAARAARSACSTVSSVSATANGTVCSAWSTMRGMS